jgi:hypothetical protein
MGSKDEDAENQEMTTLDTLGAFGVYLNPKGSGRIKKKRSKILKSNKIPNQRFGILANCANTVCTIGY